MKNQKGINNMNIRQEAERIVSIQKNYGIKCADMLAIPEEFRRDVWNEIIKIGQRESEACPYCGGE
jgi:uncharacterized Zn-finger protein